MFRLSAPKSAAVAPSATNGESAKGASAEHDEHSEANGQAAKKLPEMDELSAISKDPSSMPPPGSRRSKPNGKSRSGDGPEKWPQPKEAEIKARPSESMSDANSDQEAMLRANLPSTFGAARDKPLGKRAAREAHIMRVGAGAVISGASGRFATGRNKNGAGSSKAEAEAETEAEAGDRAEVRRQRQAEIAAITAEFNQKGSDTAPAKTDVQEGAFESGTPAQFEPGGWRHKTGNGASASTAMRRKKRLQSTAASGGRSREEEEEEEEEEPLSEDEEVEEELTEEMRIKMVVRRLGLPVSHEVQLSGHSKGVNALALDRAGGRVATGSNDYKVSVCVSMSEAVEESLYILAMSVHRACVGWVAKDMSDIPLWLRENSRRSSCDVSCFFLWRRLQEYSADRCS